MRFANSPTGAIVIMLDIIDAAVKTSCGERVNKIEQRQKDDCEDEDNDKDNKNRSGKISPY